jgi:type III restriction enzyme
VRTIEKADWKITLEQSHAQLNTLAKDAAKLENDEGTYIRPIMVIIAQPKYKGDDYDHVAEIKKYLIDKCQVQETQIRIKLSEEDGLKDDDLLDKMCPVKYIITKDALREGWDCPFAYILTILTNKNSATALTQYTGRVLRQPYAQTTPIDALNECYVFCNEANVVDAVQKIKKGLEDEGLGDIANQIRNANESDNTTLLERVTLKRNPQFQDKIFLPKLNSVLSKDNIQAFDYYRDILGEVNWADYECDAEIIVSNQNAMYQDGAEVDFDKNALDQQITIDYSHGKQSIQFDTQINFTLLTSQLTDKIPNPFEARRIIGNVISALKAQGRDEQRIAIASHDIVRQIKDHAFKWLLGKSEALFKAKLDAGKITLHLLASPKLNWDLGEVREVLKTQDDIDRQWEKNIFQPQYNSLYNQLEKDVAAYINACEAVKWWHRLGVKGTEYAVQGWTPAKIYPDFLIFQHNGKFAFIETKGNHLKNEDSAYKKQVFECLTAYKPASIGSFELKNADVDISFNLVYQDEWKDDLIKFGL